MPFDYPSPAKFLAANQGSDWLLCAWSRKKLQETLVMIFHNSSPANSSQIRLLLFVSVLSNVEGSHKINAPGVNHAHLA